MSNSALSWNDVNEGDEIPTLIKKPTEITLFMYSAITWNRHLIHYNLEAAQRDGLPGLAVHRTLNGAFLAQMLSTWLGEGGRIKNIKWRMKRTAIPGDTLTCYGKVAKKRIEGTEKLAECDIGIINQDDVIVAEGSAVGIFFT